MSDHRAPAGIAGRRCLDDEVTLESSTPKLNPGNQQNTPRLGGWTCHREEVMAMEWWLWLIIIIVVIVVLVGGFLAIQARRRSGGVIITDPGQPPSGGPR